jgi:hypothetical protein
VVGNSSKKDLPRIDSLGIVLTLPPENSIRKSHGKSGGKGEMAPPLEQFANITVH